jgi:hypothetical protein
MLIRLLRATFRLQSRQRKFEPRTESASVYKRLTILHLSNYIEISQIVFRIRRRTQFFHFKTILRQIRTVTANHGIAVEGGELKGVLLQSLHVLALLPL